MILFEHIFKTGGTTFLGSIVPAIFQKNEYIILSGFKEKNKSDILKIKNLDEEKIKSLKLIGGHNAYKLLEYFPKAKTVTLIRNPIDRAVSAYLHFLYHKDMVNNLRERNVVTPDSFEEFIKTDFGAFAYADYCSLHNYQSRVVKKIEITTAKKIDCIGFTGMYDEFLFFLNKSFCLPLVLYNKRLTRTLEKKFIPSLLDLKTIIQKNEDDIILYNKIVDSTAKYLDNMDPQEKTVLSKFSETNKIFQIETSGDINQARVFNCNE
jgi:hypothetical protein